MTNETMPQQQKAWDAARAMLDAETRERCLERAMKRWGEMLVEQDDRLLDEGFGLFSQTEAVTRKEAFMQQTQASDVWRCLLTEDYLDLLEEGVTRPPDSPLWRDLLQVGGNHVFERFRKEFVKAWNAAAKAQGLDDLVYHRDEKAEEPRGVAY